MQCACCLVVEDSMVAVEWYTFTYTHMVVNVGLIMDMDQIWRSEYNFTNHCIYVSTPAPSESVQHDTIKQCCL